MTIVDTIADAHYGVKVALAMAFAALLNEDARELAEIGVDVVQFDEPADRHQHRCRAGPSAVRFAFGDGKITEIARDLAFEEPVGILEWLASRCRYASNAATSFPLVAWTTPVRVRDLA